MKDRHRYAEFDEGPDAARRAEDALYRILQVSKEELERREAAVTEARKGRPKRGPKPRKL